MAIGDRITAFGRKSVVVAESKTWDGVLAVLVRDIDAPAEQKVEQDRAPAPEPERKVGQVRETSLEAYDKLRWNGKLTPQQLIIVSKMREDKGIDYTRTELSRLTHLAINAICGRVDELVSEPILMLVETQKRKCRVTGENAMGVALRSKT